jgi:hypothetical protein
MALVIVIGGRTRWPFTRASGKPNYRGLFAPGSTRTHNADLARPTCSMPAGHISIRHTVQPQDRIVGRAEFFLVVGALCLPGSARAAQQRDFLAVRDSLARITDSTLLRHDVDARAANHADAAIIRGLTALRLFDLTRDEDAAAAARDAFERAKRDDPASAWAAWGIGRSLVASDTARRNPAIVTGRAFAAALGLDPPSRARRAFRDALRLDPDFLPAAEALAPLAIRAQDADALVAARESLRRVTSTLSAGPGAWLALSGVERALGDLDAAESASAYAIAALTPAADAGAPPAAYVYREMAIVRFLAGLAEAGTRSWYDAIDVSTLESSEIFFEDVRVLADDFDRESFQHADLRARREWLRKFWITRAAMAGVTTADRIAEHYHRLDQAAHRYPRQRQYGAPPRNALLLERPELPFDDRGIIYIRHGEPFDIIRTPDAARVQTESWAYRMPDGNFRMVHFANYGTAERTSAAVGDPAATGANGELGEAYDEFILVYAAQNGAKGSRLSLSC